MMCGIAIGIPLAFLIYYLYQRSKRLSELIIVALLIVSCSHHIVKINEKEGNKLLPFIQDGITIKQEVLSRLGNPIESYEGGRIIIYFVVEQSGSQLEVLNYEKNNYSKVVAIYQLVLVFDPNNVLEKHSLVGNR